jgi:hypothetical membrane protein
MPQVELNYTVIIALVYFAAVLLVAQYLAPAEYSPRRHTISQLASQGYHRRRLMQAGFILYGLLFLAGLLPLIPASPAPLIRDAAHVVYGLALVPTGVFCAVPFRRGFRFSRREARLHTLFAQLSAGAFGVGIAVHAVLAQAAPTLAFHLASFVIYWGGAVWFARTRRSLGAAQRLMYAYGSVWLVATYGTGLFLAAGCPGRRRRDDPAAGRGPGYAGACSLSYS